MEESIFPVEDSLVAGMRGEHKDLVLRGDRSHTAEPGAEATVYAWIDARLAGRP